MIKKYLLINFLILFLLSIADAQITATPDQVKTDLIEIYKKYPSLRTNARPEVIQLAANEVLGATRSKNLIGFISTNTSEFVTIRSAIVAATPKITGKAVVSGQSITGMVSAAILAKSGYQVDVYDIREKYTRNIQWAGRQSLVDELASIDQSLADKFLEKVAKPLERGSIHLNSDGTKKVHVQEGLRRGDPTKVMPTGVKMIVEPSVMNMEGKIFEDVLKEYLEQQPNVRRHTGTITLGPPDKKGNYSVVGQGTPDIVIIAEGGGSKTKDLLGITSAPTSPSRLQIAGTVQIEGGGVMSKKWRNEAGDILITGTMGRKGSGKTWVVADIDPAKVTPGLEFGKNVSSPKYLAEKQRLIDLEFRRVSAEAMELPVGSLSKVKIEGAIEGKPVQTFQLQQRISSKATVGNNVIGFGDVIGNNHWSVGGGMQTGAIGHGERLKEFLYDIDRGIPRNTALKKYSDGVFSDTRAWGEIGANDFYPNLDHETAKKLYNDSIDLWKEGKVSSPQRAMELMMPEGHLSKVIRPVKLKCDEILQRILDL